MDRIVVVTKATRLDELTREYHTQGAARFALESREQSIEPYLREHAAYCAALAQVRAQLPSDVPAVYAKREELPNFLFRDKDVLVVVGPDGLFVNVAQYVGDQPILAVNPDPQTVAGVLMLYPPRGVGKALQKVAAGEHTLEALPLAHASLDDGRSIRGVNDIFIGRKDQMSARYEMQFDGQTERQSSSGIIVSTGVGSSGWMRSIRTMLTGIAGEEALGELAEMPAPSDEELVFVVREPFPSPGCGVSLVTGRVAAGEELVVKSEMPRGGYIFSDGILEKAIEFNAGTTATVTVGERYVQRVVP